MASIKLSVTHRGALRSKYRATALAKIDKAVRAWIAADKRRGIRTVHVALDDPTAMAALGVPAVTAALTAVRAKRAIDALALRLAPDYIVIVGGDDVVPQFHVANPSLDPTGEGDDDTRVPTDNPYACSRAYRAGARESYLVPDRVVGRLPDVSSAPGDGDPAWLVNALRHATAWQPRRRDFYDAVYATCCETWREAGVATLKQFGLPTGDLMISPPHTNAQAKTRRRLARTLHISKCHGTQFDACFLGEKKVRKNAPPDFPKILFSDTLRAHLKPGTLAAAMCCFGAQVFAPDDPRNNTPDSWPISLAYLRNGGVGFMGSTVIAWVGTDEMACADWIVTGYLKKCLAGASTGRALLESKQDYLQFLYGLGQQPDTADEKTMIEFVLLGDPSLHPVRSAAAPTVVRAAGHAASAKVDAALDAQTVQRAERRAARAVIGSATTKRLPQRVAAALPQEAFVRECYQVAVAALSSKPDLGRMRPAAASATQLRMPASAARATAAPARAGLSPAAAPVARAVGQAMEYAWCSRQVVDGTARVRLLKAQFDATGNLLRARLLHSA